MFKPCLNHPKVKGFQFSLKPFDYQSVGVDGFEPPTLCL